MTTIRFFEANAIGLSHQLMGDVETLGVKLGLKSAK